MKLTLHSYWRSSASYRLRIALNLKKIDYSIKAVDLLAGEQKEDAYRKLNPLGLVPTLLISDGTAISQSLAALEYLEEAYPQPSILPPDSGARILTREIALTVACEIHPLNNLSTLAYLQRELGTHQSAKMRWYHHFLARGFDAIEKKLDKAKKTAFCVCDFPTIADICLVPQVYNARRFDYCLDRHPNICRIDSSCAKMEAFVEASPENQPDSKP